MEARVICEAYLWRESTHVRRMQEMRVPWPLVVLQHLQNMAIIAVTRSSPRSWPGGGRTPSPTNNACWLPTIVKAQPLIERVCTGVPKSGRGCDSNVQTVIARVIQPLQI